MKALRENLPDVEALEPKYSEEYNRIVHSLEQESGTSLEEFKVLPEDITKFSLPAEPSYNFGNGNGNLSMSAESIHDWIDKPLLLMKLDGLLGYFEVKYVRREEPQIGFNRPQ